ncbi:unnamed protein product [Effrenium voratum]|uniref:Uncharacterized protein n=1 Tax=Effrenium voratum TaxID=2562239 RepID=A0AA36HP12_9DINO|nr:unnamed protein product [Effrenium voratum]
MLRIPREAKARILRAVQWSRGPEASLPAAHGEWEHTSSCHGYRFFLVLVNLSAGLPPESRCQVSTSVQAEWLDVGGRTAMSGLIKSTSSEIGVECSTARRSESMIPGRVISLVALLLNARDAATSSWPTPCSAGTAEPSARSSSCARQKPPRRWSESHRFGKGFVWGTGPITTAKKDRKWASRPKSPAALSEQAQGQILVERKVEAFRQLAANLDAQVIDQIVEEHNRRLGGGASASGLEACRLELLQCQETLALREQELSDCREELQRLREHCASLEDREQKLAAVVGAGPTQARAQPVYAPMCLGCGKLSWLGCRFDVFSFGEAGKRPVKLKAASAQGGSGLFMSWQEPN